MLVVLLAIIGALALIVGLLLVIFAFRDAPRHEAPKVAAEGGQATFFVRGEEGLAGTNFIKMTIAASEGSGGNPYGSLSRSGEEDIRNILLIDRTSGASRRILPDNNRRIEDVQFLTADAEPVAPAPAEVRELEVSEPRPRVVRPVAYYFLRVRRPAEGGKAPTFDLLVGTLATGRQGFVMQSIDGVETYWMRSPNHLAMLVREKLGLYYRVIDIPAVKVVQSRRIEID